MDGDRKKEGTWKRKGMEDGGRVDGDGKKDGTWKRNGNRQMEGKVDKRRRGKEGSAGQEMKGTEKGRKGKEGTAGMEEQGKEGKKIGEEGRRK